MATTTQLDIQEKTSDYALMSVSVLRRNQDNPRGVVSVDDIRELAASIRIHGILQPLIVKADGEIIAGERRFKAAQFLGLDTVPVIVREPQDNSEKDELALIENIQRENLNPVSEARAFQALIDKGSTVQKVAERTGVAPERINRLLRLLRLPNSIQEAVESGTVAVTSALTLLKLEDADKQVSIASEAVAEHLSAEQIAERVEAAQSKPASFTQPARSESSIVNRAEDRIDEARILLATLPAYAEFVPRLESIKTLLEAFDEDLIDFLMERVRQQRR